MVAAVKIGLSGGLNLLKDMLGARTTRDVERILNELPIVNESDYTWSVSPWRAGHLHWIPVGRDRGNAGRIQLAGDPYNPPAERLVNGMEALIEMERQLELLTTPESPAPRSPRDAVARYYRLPRLDEIPRQNPTERKQLEERLRDVRKRLRLRLDFDRKSGEFCVEVADRGIGQAPARVHQTLLSLGQTDKADKPYLIGVFGQGGSSAYAVSDYSLLFSRRHSQLLAGHADGIAYTFVKKVSPKGRRDPYYAYLAISADGQVPTISIADAGDTFEHGTTFRHIGYDFGARGSAIARTLYPALNHVLFNPVLPYELFALKTDADPMYGNANRLARRTEELKRTSPSRHVLDKYFQPQTVGATV